jgi:hypothetical protein
VSQKPLGEIRAKYKDEAIRLRVAMDELTATFASGTDEQEAERQKVTRLIEMILHEHMKTAAGAIKMLVLGLVKSKPQEAVEILKQHLHAVAAQQSALVMARAHLSGDLKDPPQVQAASEAELRQHGLTLKKGGKK